MRVHVSSPEEGTVFEGRWGVEVVSTDGDAILSMSMATEAIISGAREVGDLLEVAADVIGAGVVEAVEDPEVVRDFGDELGEEFSEDFGEVADTIEEVREEILSDQDEEDDHA